MSGKRILELTIVCILQLTLLAGCDMVTKGRLQGLTIGELQDAEAAAVLATPDGALAVAVNYKDTSTLEKGSSRFSIYRVDWRGDLARWPAYKVPAAVGAMTLDPGDRLAIAGWRDEGSDAATALVTLVKVSDGAEAWSREYPSGVAADDKPVSRARSIALVGGDVVVCGEVTDKAGTRAFVASWAAAAGEPIGAWEMDALKTTGTGRAWAVARDGTGGVAVAGERGGRLWIARFISTGLKDPVEWSEAEGGALGPGTAIALDGEALLVLGVSVSENVWTGVVPRDLSAAPLVRDMGFTGRIGAVTPDGRGGFLAAGVLGTSSTQAIAMRIKANGEADTGWVPGGGKYRVLFPGAGAGRGVGIGSGGEDLVCGSAGAEGGRVAVMRVIEP